MSDPTDPCGNCGHRRELHYDGGDGMRCHYLHPHSGACGDRGGMPPYGAGNTTTCPAFEEPRGGLLTPSSSGT
jgi:hypothetical protein